MTADELRAITAAGPAVVMVAKDDMLALLDMVPVWRPIGTAPRDGTAVIGWCPSIYRGNGGCLLMLWAPSEQRPEGRWAFPGNLYGGLKPAHWMPLPAPPQQETTDDE